MHRERLSLDAVWHGIGAQLRCPSGFFGRFAGSAMRLVNAKPNALAIAALGLKDGDSVLELGCGPGHALHAMMRERHLRRVAGLDWSEVMLAQARRRNRAAIASGRLTLVRGDFAELPFADASVDAILAVNVAYFMRGCAALGEARRVLRPGGRIVLYATDAAAMSRWRFAGEDTHRLFDRDRLTLSLVEAGFAKECVRIELVDAGFDVLGLVATAASA
jgi:SAM-dependent methyltransferase